MTPAAVIAIPKAKAPIFNYILEPHEESDASVEYLDALQKVAVLGHLPANEPGEVVEIPIAVSFNPLDRYEEDNPTEWSEEDMIKALMGVVTAYRVIMQQRTHRGGNSNHQDTCDGFLGCGYCVEMACIWDFLRTSTSQLVCGNDSLHSNLVDDECCDGSVRAVLRSEYPEEYLCNSPRGLIPERDAILKPDTPVRWEFDDEGQAVRDAGVLTFPSPKAFAHTFSDDGCSEWVNAMVPGFGRCQDLQCAISFFSTIGFKLKFLTLALPETMFPTDLDVNLVIKHIWRRWCSTPDLSKWH
ncbi:unnamed protein product [Phytophthora lilii]|uniref:Unnamed protein product n=1 Tax=Phytophthora lilii TaxID=2077276 RepID=A0A9W6TGZ9_9STRA|nr:unnamed protein product [Phytophthora lilii]